MSKNKLPSIPRAPQESDAAPSLDEWVAGDEPAGAPQTIIRAIVTPEQRRYLRGLAFEQDTSMSKIIRELIDRRMAEDNE